MTDKNPSPEPGSSGSFLKQATAHSQRAMGWALLAPGEAMQWASRLDRKTLAWGSLALAAIMFVSLNLAVSLAGRNVKADLTQERLFTISDSTKKVLSRLQDPINVRVYFSHRLGEVAPTFQRHFERVKGLLEQYRDLSNGKLQVTFLDPEPFSDAEERASAAGLRGQRLNQDGETGYFGLVASNLTDNDAVVSFFQPDRERFLEYDLTKLINGLSNPKKKVIGLISGVPIDGGMNPMSPRGQPMPPWAVMEQIREFFEVRTLEPAIKEIPKDIDVLMLVQPSNLSKDAAYAIDQYALSGGHILAFVDPVTETSPGDMMGMGSLPVSPDFRNIMVHWGLNFDPDKIVGDPSTARRVQFGGGPGGQPVVTDYLSWLQVEKGGINDKDPLAASIKRLNLASAGALTKVDGATTIIQPLLETSADAGLIDAMTVRFRPDPLAIRRAFKSGGTKLMLAARIGGEAKTAFPDGRPKDEDKTKAADAKPDAAKPAAATPADAAKPAEPAKAEAPKSEAAKPAEPDKSHIAVGRVNVVVVADSDMLADQFWVDVQNFLGQQVAVPSADNAGFVVNALENLSSGEALAGLRGRGVVDRPFDRVVDIRRNAEAQYRQKEEALVARLQDLRQKLAQVETKGDDANQQVILSDTEKQEIEKFRTEMISVGRQLRDVKAALRRDIERLDNWLKFFNIAAIPLLIGLGGLGASLLRRRNKTDA
ncbi:MAG: GldG family protein [Proteobacteria bacterium]|nr:GldG family protein [Pseudomonadota bacterium]